MVSLTLACVNELQSIKIIIVYFLELYPVAKSQAMYSTLYNIYTVVVLVSKGFKVRLLSSLPCFFFCR